MWYLIKKALGILFSKLLQYFKQDLISKMFNFMKREIMKSVRKGEWVKLGLAGAFLLGAFLILFLM